MPARTTTRSTSIRLNGSSSSCQLDLFQWATSIVEASKRSSPAICAATASAIFSPASEHGPTPSVAQDGPMTGLSGPDHARANLSPRRARELGLLTSGISGQRGIGSSNSADLQSSLENRLRTSALILGSTSYKLTWKPWTTPSGPSRSRLRASAVRKGEIVFTGWPTPRVGNNNGHGNAARAHRSRLEDVVQLARGISSISSTSGTDPVDLLNPAHCRWLQGLPPSWDVCADMATRYVPKLPLHSSQVMTRLFEVPMLTKLHKAMREIKARQQAALQRVAA